MIELRPEAPLVRTTRELDGFPAGTLGCIEGVDGPFIQVRLAGSDGPTLMRATEMVNV